MFLFIKLEYLIDYFICNLFINSILIIIDAL